MKKIYLLFSFLFLIPWSSFGQGQFFYVCTENKELLKLNLANCDTTFIGYTDSTIFGDIALTPDYRLYGVSGRILFEIDTSNAKITLIDTITNMPGVNSLVSDSAGNLLTVAEDSLYQLNRFTAHATSLGYFGNYISEGDLAFYNDTLYLAANDSILVQITLYPTLSSRLIGTMAASNIFGLATVCLNDTQRLIASGGYPRSSIYIVNTATAALTLLCDSISVNIWGAASALGDFDTLSDCIAVAIFPPTVGFQVAQTSICANDCVNFTNNSTNSTSWQWNFAGAADSTSTAQNPQNICYLNAGVYDVSLVASNSKGSDTLTLKNYITVSAAPSVPVVTQVHNDTLFCSTSVSYTSYQWYLGTTIINGATDTFLVISKSGNYNVEVANSNGCKISEGINVILGVQNYMSDYSISLYPNPAGDKFTVYGLQFTGATMVIYNVLGQEASPPAPLQRRGENAEVDVSALAAGVYFVQIVGEKERWVGKFVKE